MQFKIEDLISTLNKHSQPGRVARKFGRSFIGIDIKEEYCEMAKRRVRSDTYQDVPEYIVPLTEIFEEGSI